MISFLRRHQKILFIATIAIFLMGTFVGLGGYLFTSRDTGGSVATVGKTKIPYAAYASRVNQYADTLRVKGADVTDAEMKEIKQGILRDMIVDELLEQKADEMGIVVTDIELAHDIQNTPAFQQGGQFNQPLYYGALRSVLHETPETYEARRRKQIKASKFKLFVYLSSKISPLELREAYAAKNKGVMKNFDKDRPEFAQSLQQSRAQELINYYLRQLTSQIEIHTYIDQRESGV